MINIKLNRLIILILVILLTANVVGCSNKEKTPEEPYLKYIITTYSGGKEINKFEVWSNMGWYFGSNSIKVYDNPSENELLFRTTLDYKVEQIR